MGVNTEGKTKGRKKPYIAGRSLKGKKKENTEMGKAHWKETREQLG